MRITLAFPYRLSALTPVQPSAKFSAYFPFLRKKVGFEIAVFSVCVCLPFQFLNQFTDFHEVQY
jgi:hypothetical protein